MALLDEIGGKSLEDWRLLFSYYLPRDWILGSLIYYELLLAESSSTLLLYLFLLIIPEMLDN